MKKNPTIGFTLILQLTGVHGSHQFDKLTKTKTVETILTSMTKDGIQSYIEYLLKQVNDEHTYVSPSTPFGSSSFLVSPPTHHFGGYLLYVNLPAADIITDTVSPIHLCSTDIQALNARRGWIVDQLAALIRNGAIPKDDQWVQTVLDWFVVHGLFAIKKKSEKSSLLAVCLCRHPLLICLSHA